MKSPPNTDFLPALRNVLGELLSPFGLVLDPADRLFWPFLASALALATFAYLRQARGQRLSARNWLSFVLPRSVWAHPSTRLDIKLLFAKALLNALTFIPRAFPLAVAIALVSTALQVTLGPTPPLPWPKWALLLAFSVSAFIVEDFSRYAFHRLMHRVPWLWALHQVHHSAEVLSPLTLYRTHPLESLFYRLREVAALGLVTGIFMYWFGPRLQGWEILGVDALGFCFNFAGANLRHSHIWISFGPRVERWLISPAQHQLHHSRSPAHHDRNFGTFLSLWDRLSGTLVLAEPRTPLTFGLEPGEANHSGSLTSTLWDPLKASFRSMIGRAPAAKSRS